MSARFLRRILAGRRGDLGEQIAQRCSMTSMPRDANLAASARRDARCSGQGSMADIQCTARTIEAEIDCTFGRVTIIDELASNLAGRRPDGRLRCLTAREKADVTEMLELAGLDRFGTKSELFDGRTGEVFDRKVTVGIHLYAEIASSC